MTGIYKKPRVKKNQRELSGLQPTGTYSDGIGVPHKFVDVEGLSAELPGVMLQHNAFPSTAVQGEGRPVSFPSYEGKTPEFLTLPG